VVGYALYAFDYSSDTGSREMFLHDLFVRAAYRGQGVGEALMNRLTEICRAAGISFMHWLVRHANEPAIRFYEKMGARSIDTVRLMRLTL